MVADGRLPLEYGLAGLLGMIPEAVQVSIGSVASSTAFLGIFRSLYSLPLAPFSEPQRCPRPTSDPEEEGPPVVPMTASSLIGACRRGL